MLGQLVILDGEDVTVQVTQDQFEEYNKLKAENEDLREIIKKALEDFRGEYGTNDYDRLLVRASKHKIDISDFGEILYGKE